MSHAHDIRILVPTDFAREAGDAVERAIELAQSLRVSALHVVHIRRSDEAASPIGPRNDLRTRLQTALCEVRHPIAFDVLEREAPNVVDGILAVAQDTSSTLVLIGSRGGGLLSEGIAEQLIHRGKVDVLVVAHTSDRRWPHRRTRILVPVDFSDNARRALTAARALAGDNPVTVLHVADAADDDDEVRERITTWAPGEALDIAVERGDPARVVAECVRDSQVGLVVVGAKGVRDEGGLIVSGVPERLISVARSPVLVVH